MAAVGYESASLGLWGWACTLQLVVGLLCTSASYHLSHWEDVHNPTEQQISYVTASTFSHLGRASFAFAAILIVCVFLGYFVIPRFSNLLTGLAGMLSAAVSLACTVIMGLILSKALPVLISFWTEIKHITEPPKIDYTVFFAYNTKPSLMAIGVLSFVSFVLALRALVMTSNASAIDAMLYAGCLAIAAAIGSYVVLQGDALRSLLVLGISWTSGTALFFILLTQQKVCWPRFSSIVIAVLSALLAFLSLICLSICGRKLIKERLYEILVFIARELVLLGLTGEDKETAINVLKTNLSFDYYVLTALNAAAALAFAAACLAALRSVLGPSPAEKEMAQDSAEEASEGTSEA